jgi:peptidoglycan glycosyltransferase
VNRRIRRLGVGLVALIGLLFLQVSYIQVFAAGRIAADPANARRQIIAEYKVERGPIITADGTVIALSEPTGANASLRYVRKYPDGPLFAGITGFYSQVYGRTELEQSMNTYLAGDAPELTVSTLADLVLGRPKKGGTVITTIDAGLQRVASDALGAQPGGVVAMDPRNGDVMAMVSNPTFDPNELSSQDTEAVRAAWERLNADPRTPLLSRANDELFPPGSTFKMVTASAALENGYGLDSVWDNPHELDLPLTDATIQNFGGETCPGGATTTLLTAFTHSCNVIFGEVGLRSRRTRCRSRRTRTASARPIRRRRPSAWSRRSPSRSRSRRDGSRPRATSRERTAPRRLRDRTGQRPGQPVTDGPGGVRHREPRRDDDASSGDGDPRPAGAHHQDLPRRVVRPAHLGEGRRRDARDDGERRGERDRHGRTDPRHRGRGQDRHRAARRTRLGAPCVVRLLRARGTGEEPSIVVAVIVLDGGSLGSEATGGQVAAPIARQILEAYLAG